MEVLELLGRRAFHLLPQCHAVVLVDLERIGLDGNVLFQHELIAIEPLQSGL